MQTTIRLHEIKARLREICPDMPEKDIAWVAELALEEEVRHEGDRLKHESKPL